MNTLQETELKIRKAYESLNKRIYKTVLQYADAFYKDDEKRRKEVELGRLTRETYEQWRKRELLFSAWSRKMQKAIVDDIDATNNEARELSESKRSDAYAEGAVAGLAMLAVGMSGRTVTARTARGLKDMGYTFTVTGSETARAIAPTIHNVAVRKSMYNQKMMARILSENPSLLPPPSDATLARIKREGLKRWNMQKVNSEIVAGIQKGESVPKVAKRLQKVANMDRAQSIRTARTALTNARNRAVFQRGLDAMRLGFDEVTKIWIATHDGRTRESHRDIDGEEMPLLDYFSNDLMFPADEDGEAAEVYNCRCGMKIILGDSSATEKEAEEAIGL